MRKAPVLSILPLLVGPALAQPADKVAGFDAGAIDRSAPPCVDFYEYACGTWMKNNPIPPDQSRWGRFNELTERNRETLHLILEKASVDDPKRDPVQRLIGDYYASCMDEKAVNALGQRPLEPELLRIDRTATNAEPPRLVEGVPLSRWCGATSRATCSGRTSSRPGGSSRRSGGPWIASSGACRRPR